MFMREIVAKAMTKFFRLIADTFFAKRYGHRAVVLETVAGVPGMVAGMLLHFASLRKMKTGYGADIRDLLAEAENERMHLMFFIEIAKPIWFERWLVLIAQFTLAFFIRFYTWSTAVPPTEWSPILKKKRCTVIPNTWTWWRAASWKTFQPRSWPSTTMA